MDHKKCNKIVILTAIAGTFAAFTAAVVTLTKHFKKKNPASDDNTTAATDDQEMLSYDDSDINGLDMASINNDTPRQYVSISINEHIGGNNEESGK